VNIASFAFMPAKISAAVGKALTFFNADDTPHQVSVVNGPRTAVFLNGQKPRSPSTSRASTATSAGCTPR
jgi:plastocyanin